MNKSLSAIGTGGLFLLSLTFAVVSLMLFNTLTWSGVFGAVGGAGAVVIFSIEIVKRMMKNTAPRRQSG